MEMIIVKGMSAMCSTCGHGVSYYSRWSHSSTSIAHDGCTFREDENGNHSFKMFYNECGCKNPIPEPGTENYHHCRISDLKIAGFENAEYLTSITPETLEEWKEIEKKVFGK